MSVIKTFIRYWFVAPLLLTVMSCQVGLGLFAANNSLTNEALGQKTVTVENTGAPPLSQTVVLVPTQIPTNTPTPSPSPTATPTFTPSPTRTPTDTPTGTRQPTLTPSSTPNPTPTSTSIPALLPTPIGPGSTAIVPILMYHYLSIPPADANAIRLDLSVNPARFESHLAYLRQEGYETISMEQLAVALSGQAQLPPKPIIITFDDGYRDNYENTFPLLRKYGYNGTFFIFTKPIDFLSEKYITWDMVKEMHKAGMEFGSHSYSHPDMSGTHDDFQIFEVLASKEAIEERIEEPVRFFAYPSGQYDELTIRVLASAHFWGAVTTEWGAAQSYADRFEMSRIRVRGSDTAEDLAEKLSLFED